ncbi:hypothetical protein [Sporosarcina beigongshangi]|nr:hypothetical protein [Sporosarcina beigongshangi]
MMIAKMNVEKVSKLVNKNKTESPTHYLGGSRLTETVLATP